MRSVKEFTERIASLGPLPWSESSEAESGAESEPAPDRYKCPNCGREANPDADRCPNCSSPNLRPLYF